MSEIIDGVFDVTSFEQLTTESIDRLARFNAESSRGIVHTDEYCERMAKLQERFDRHQLNLNGPPKKKRWWQT